MNSFDAVVLVVAAVAIVAGYRSGLLRSMATILGYLVAMPIALGAAPLLTPATTAFQLPAGRNLLMFGTIFMIVGIGFSALFRFMVSEFVGPDASLLDRLAGALLGAVRVGLLAVLMVLIFDRIIPLERQPAFLTDSRLRPILSDAGRDGLRSLPPDVGDFIDRLKRNRGI